MISGGSSYPISVFHSRMFPHLVLNRVSDTELVFDGTTVKVSVQVGPPPSHFTSHVRRCEEPMTVDQCAHECVGQTPYYPNPSSQQYM